MPYEHHLQLNKDVLSYRNTPQHTPENDPWNSSSPRSLRRPKQQVMDWIKAPPFHVSCVRYCVDKSTPTVFHPHQPCFRPLSHGRARPKLRVPTPFAPLSSYTGGGNWTPSAHAGKKKKTPCPNTSHFCVLAQTLPNWLSRYNGTHRIGSSIVLFV